MDIKTISHAITGGNGHEENAYGCVGLMLQWSNGAMVGPGRTAGRARTL